MKHLCTLASLFAAVAFARADIVIEQKMESAFMNGNTLMKIKGDKSRMDVPNPLGGNVTVITDLKTGSMTTLMHAQKMSMKMSLDAAKKQAEAGQKQLGIDPAKLEKPKATGKMEKVGEWDAEIYTMDSPGMKGKMWVVKDFPGGQAIKEQMNKFSAASGGGIDPSKLDVPGMPVKTEMETTGGKMTMTLIKAKEETVDDKEFDLPKDYNEMKLPGQ